MAFIKLIRSRSFSDGTVTANDREPVIEVPDVMAQHYINTGFFAAMDDAAQVMTEKIPEETEEGLIFSDDEDPVPTAEERLKEELEGMSAKELKAYASKKGIDLASASKKDAIITTIVEADRKAAEARQALRQE